MSSQNEFLFYRFIFILFTLFKKLYPSIKLWSLFAYIKKNDLFLHRNERSKFRDLFLLYLQQKNLRIKMPKVFQLEYGGGGGSETNRNLNHAERELISSSSCGGGGGVGYGGTGKNRNT